MTTSNPEFNEQTTATEAAAALGKEIRGKNVLITGVSPIGIGATTALGIASQGPGMLILASRTKEKVGQVAAEIGQKYPSVPVKVILLDLASVRSITSAAGEVDAAVDRLDVLINNAGISAMERSPLATPDGTVVDLTFFTNHLGVFLLTWLLLPRLRTAGAGSPGEGRRAARVVNLSSHGHRLSPVRFSDYAFSRDLYEGVPEAERPVRNAHAMIFRQRDGYPGFVAYAQSKTANILHAWELSRRLRARGDERVVAFSVHPGTIATELSRGLDEPGRAFIQSTAPHGLWKSQEAGGATSIVAAFDPKLAEADIGGSVVGYLSDCQLADHTAAPHARDADAARRLWEESEKMLAIATGL